MPGARWFPGAQVNYAQQVFRHVQPAHAAGFMAIVSRNEKGQPRRDELARAAPPGGVAGAAPAGPGRAARRPRGRVPAQHSRGHGGVSGHGEHRRRVEHVRARHGHQRRARPLPPDRTDGADRLRRRDLRRARLRPPGRGGRAARGPAHGAPCGAAHQPGRRMHRPPTAALQAAAPCTAFAEATARMDAAVAAVRAALAALRPPAVDRVFQRHHRPAQAHRARPRRHHHRGAGAQDPAQRHRLQLRAQQLGRALPLVQLHRLGDVERADQRPAQRHHLRDL